MPERLDRLEARAADVLERTYGPMLDREARGWIQKGIEGMRLAVAEEALAERSGQKPADVSQGVPPRTTCGTPHRRQANLDPPTDGTA